MQLAQRIAKHPRATPDEYVILLPRRILVRVPRRVQVVAPRAEAVRVAHVEHQCHRKLIGFL